MKNVMHFPLDWIVQLRRIFSEMRDRRSLKVFNWETVEREGGGKKR